jgi:type III secretion protein W
LSNDHHQISGVEGPGKMSQARIQELAGQRKAGRIEARQDAIKESMTERAEQATFNPMQMSKKGDFKSLNDRTKHLKAEKKEQAEEAILDEEIYGTDTIAKVAKEYQDRNPEMKRKGLMNLKEAVKEGDRPQDIIGKALKYYPDQFLTDEALSYLLETTDQDSELYEALVAAKKQFGDKYGREITAGKNINTEAREFSRQGLGTPEGLRNLYRDITANPRDANTMFDELSQTFTFDKLKTALGFLLHSLGSDLKAKGSSIDKPELMRLITETKVLQAILGVYRFFSDRMNMVKTLFDHAGMSVPSKISFEILAKQFMEIIKDRYPSPDKILMQASKLGITSELLAQIIIFGQFRDALRGVSNRFFKSERHRQDLLLTFMETLSELEDLLDDEEEDDDEKARKLRLEEFKRYQDSIDKGEL